MFRFLIKAGLAGTAVYYVNEEGIWRSSAESLKTYDRLNTAIEPYLTIAKKQLPFEIPAIPKNINSCELAQNGWNRGVESTFQFLIAVPEKVTIWTQENIKSLLENPEVQKFFN